MLCNAGNMSFETLTDTEKPWHHTGCELVQVTFFHTLCLFWFTLFKVVFLSLCCIMPCNLLTTTLFLSLSVSLSFSSLTVPIYCSTIELLFESTVMLCSPLSSPFARIYCWAGFCACVRLLSHKYSIIWQYVRFAGSFNGQKASMCLYPLTGATQPPRRRVDAPESSGGEQTWDGC